MHRELAWPQLLDLLPGRGLWPYSQCVVAGAVVAMVTLKLGWASPLVTLLAGTSAFLAGRHRLNFGRTESPPKLRGTDSLCQFMPEPSAWASFNVALLLGALGWPQQNVLVFLGFSPFILYRLYSRLWLEVDLERGEIHFYRTFLGLQVSSGGLDLGQAEHVLSGRPEELPGQPLSYSVRLKLQDHQELLLHLALEPQDCHRWGRALARRLDLPHYCQEEGENPPTYPEQTWTPLESKFAHSGVRAALPWESL